MRLITNDMRGQELYFDLRPLGVGKEEGFWATPIFDGDRQRIQMECEARGQANKTWIEMLAFSVKRWIGFLDTREKELPCTPDTIRALCESDPSAMQDILTRILNAGRTGVLLDLKN